MKASDPTNRRSDEIRRRRSGQTPTIPANTSGKGGTQPAANDRPLLERLLGKRRVPAAARQTPRMPVAPGSTAQSSARVTSRRRLNVEASASLSSSSPTLAGRTARRERPPLLERLFGRRVEGRSGRGTAARSSVRTAQPAPPPVLARGKYVDSPAAPLHRTARTRRVYDVPLNAQGAEMRLPALPRLRVSWRMASLFLLALVGTAMYYLWTAPAFQVDRPLVSGLKRLPAGLVNKELALTGKPIFTLDVAEIEHDLLTIFPEFSAAQVQVELPNTVMITVTERAPVMIWKQDDREHLVDADGMTFPARQDLAPGALPMVEAAGDPPLFAGGVDAPGELQEGSAADAAAEAAADTLEAVKQALPESLRRTLPDENKAIPLLSPQMVSAVLQLSEMAPDGSQVIYDRQHGFGWQDRRGWMVYFGNFEDMDVKLHVYRAILDALKESGTRPELISVEYAYAPFYRVQRQEQQ